jgi:dTDP-glucose 4,6-dehydratase
MRVHVTGGAGFIGSHLCDALLARGDAVVCLDNLSTGRVENIRHLRGRSDFEFIHADVTTGIESPGPVDAVIHMASPASPPDYLSRPLETLDAGSNGTGNALRLAQQHRARFVLASTSEIYGDPAVHPQPEDYWGNVNPIGPRSVYDEAKRFAEALTCAYGRTLGLDAGIVRIFNTYGPRMTATDGRVVSNFISQALRGEPLVVYGDGSQTRSFCYVDDLVRGLLAMIDSAVPDPVNLGNPEEITVADFAQLVLEITGSSSPVVRGPLPVDDPVRRRPLITRARELLGWAPEVCVAEGLRRTVDWFQSQPMNTRAADADSWSHSGMQPLTGEGGRSTAGGADPENPFVGPVAG